MNNATDKIKQFWNEHPIETIIIATMAATAAAKLMEASTERSRARTWEKEVDRRDRMSRR